MNRLKQLSVWLSRIRKCRGFGVQSPSAYRLIKYVINEHYPYYAYEELAVTVPDIGRTERKLCRLYFRMANERQAAVWLNISENPRLMKEKAVCQYVVRGCGNTKVLCVAHGQYDGWNSSVVQIVRLVLDGSYQQSYPFIINKVGEESVLIIEGIHQHREARKFWKEVVNDVRTGVTFDLYDCGLVFFDKKRTKQHYIVNF